MGGAYGTAKAGQGLMAMGVRSPELLMQNIIPIVMAGVLGILLGVFGIHKFVLGYTSEGIILLIISLVTCGIAGSIMGLIEGIVYLTKSDEEFVYMYQTNKKAWF